MSNLPADQKLSRRRKPKATPPPRGVLPAVFAALYHKVYYRPAQVKLSMPCFQEGQKPTIGMRLAMLDNRSECALEEIPEPIFATGHIERISGDLVTLKYDRHPHGAVSITFGWEATKLFCVPLTEDREAWTEAATKRRRKAYPND